MSFYGEVKAKTERLARFGPKLKERLYLAVVRLTIELQAYIKQSKLSGQVLKNRTGTLRRSINRRVERTPTSIKGIVGTNVKYGRAHEFGFHGKVPVREHLRLVKKAWGKDLKTPVWATVRAHETTLNLPERSFLRSALKDKREYIIQTLTAASREV